MNTYDPVGLLFGGMEKLGPGGNAHTLHVLRLLPKQPFRIVVDAGCGTGRQTLALAKELGTLVHAVDSYEPFLNDLERRAQEAKIEQLVQAHCMDMKDIPQVFQDIDLLWSEGAAYNIGFSNALATWAPAIIPDGFAVISELSWLKEQAPDAVKEFFRSGYPDMQSVEHNVAVAERAGYKILSTYTLPRRPGWMATTTFSRLGRRPCLTTRIPQSEHLPPKPSERSRFLSVRKTVMGMCSTCFNVPNQTLDLATIQSHLLLKHLDHVHR